MGTVPRLVQVMGSFSSGTLNVGHFKVIKVTALVQGVLTVIAPVTKATSSALNPVSLGLP